MGRMFGCYRCTNCNKEWMSAFAWQGGTQACKSCGTHVAPYSLEPLERSNKKDKIDPTKEHRRDLCSKCKSLGYFCGNNASRFSRY